MRIMKGEEGLFYVWQKAEIDAILGTDAPLFNAVYGVTEQGNWEGSNVLHVAREPNDVAQERVWIRPNFFLNSISTSQAARCPQPAHLAWPRRQSVDRMERFDAGCSF